MRLIDADTLNYVRVRICHDDGTIGGYNAVVPSSVINNAPTVDAEPVRHGKWLCTDGFEEYGVCSECMYNSYEPIYYVCNKWKYCPRCGAKMDGES